MSEPDETKVNSDKIKKKIIKDKKIKKKIIKDKKKLLEIYALVSGLIIASIQNTGSLIAINISANETIYKESILATQAIIETSNTVFFVFIFLLLIYYTKTFDEDATFTWFLVISISASFSYILVNFIKLYMDLSFWGLFAPIFLATVLTLFQNSILIIEKERKISKTRNNIYALKIWSWRTSLLKSIIWGATVYLIFCIWGAYNPFAYTLINLWTISATVLSIFLECLRQL